MQWKNTWKAPKYLDSAYTEILAEFKCLGQQEW